MKEFIGFDIETRPRLDLVERFTKPFADFDEAKCRAEYATARDPAKGPTFIAKKREEHESERMAYWQNARERAQLSPLTGEVCIIGTVTSGGIVSYFEGDEATMLRSFWQLFNSFGEAVTRFVFWSGCGSPSKMFDVDFMVTRSRILGVPLPPTLRNGRYYSARIVDLASEFLLYQPDAYLSLSKGADAMGFYDDERLTPGLFRKSDTDTVTGEFFHLWYDGKAQCDFPAHEQRMTAMRYLENDLWHVYHAANRIL
jgi:hypothetical protein